MMLLSRVITGVVAALMIYWSGVEMRDRFNPDTLFLREDLVARAQALADAGRLAEGRMLAEFVVAQPQFGDAARAAELAASIDSRLSSFRDRARRYLEGMASGEPRDLAGLLGSLTLDVFVLGDIRDLLVQGWREFRYDNGDELILALSAAGLVTSLAPEVDWAPALLKAYVKAGAFTRRFLDQITDVARQAFRSGDFTKLATTSADGARAVRKLGPGPLRGALGAVDDTQDLAKLAKAAERDAASAYTLASVFGNSALRLLTPDAANITAVLRLIKTGTRAVKIGDKTLLSAPVETLPWIFGVALLILVLVAIPYRKLRRNRPVAVVLLAMLLVGCQTVPEAVRTPTGPALEQVRENPAAHVNQPIRWGGTIARTENLQTQTWLHIVGRALDSQGRPIESDRSTGRFVARASGFLDPEIHARGREITVTGRYVETITSLVGEYPYPTPVASVDTVYLWDKRPEPAPYWPYYDPFYPWWGYPWGYPYRYPYHPRW